MFLIFLLLNVLLKLPPVAATTLFTYFKPIYYLFTILKLIGGSLSSSDAE